MNVSRIAGYLFVLGLIVAVVAGVLVNLFSVGSSVQAWISVIFVALGVAIGFFMSTSKKIEEEIYVLLLVTVAFIIASNMNVFEGITVATGTKLGSLIDSIVGYIAMFSAAAIIVLAIRTITRFHVSKIKKIK